MPPRQQQQSNPNQDSGLGPIWLVVLLFATLGVIWYFGHTYIVIVVFKIRLMEAHLIQLFTNKVDRAIHYMQTVPPSTVPFADLAGVSDFVGRFFRYPVMALLVVLGIILYFSDPTLRFRKTYNMKTLREEACPNWPAITPVVALDLVETEVDEGPWAMASSPLAFCTQHRLAKKDLVAIEKARFRRGEVLLSIKRGEAKRVFTLQLGPTWQGVDALKGHMRALFALFAAKMNRDRDAVNDLLDQINASTRSDRLDFSGAEKLLQRYKNTELVQHAVYGHAYLYGVMASMLEAARDDGVFPTSEFLWLKPIDRQLWYMLNTVGRQTVFTEVAGPYAHWLAERALGRKILSPMVSEAVSALEVAMKDIKMSARDFERSGIGA